MLPDVAVREDRLAKESGKDRASHRERADELAIEWQAFVADIVAHGVREAVKIVPILPEERPADMPARVTHWVVDGRHRLQAAIDGGIGFIPAEEVSRDAIPDIILSAVTRRHFSKGALAYMAVLTMPEVAKGGAARAKAGKPSALSAEGLARRIGVSPRLMEQACELYRELDGFPALAGEAEASVFGGSGLGAVCGWVKGQKTAGSADRPVEKREPNYDALATSSLVTLRNASRAWDRLSDATRAEVIAGVREVLSSLPPAVRDAVIS